MKKKTLSKGIFLLFTISNVVIFLNRGNFSYRDNSSHESLYNTCNDHCLAKWNQFANDYPKAELTETQQIIDSLLGSEKTGNIQKIIATGHWLRKLFHTREGTPSLLLARASPLKQFKLLSHKKDEKLWCGNYAIMFAWFCQSQGITTRIIEILKPGNHHVVNECYLPEKQQWVMVDLTSNLLLIENSHGQLLQLPQFIEKCNSNQPITAYRSIADIVQKENIQQANIGTRHYFKKEYTRLYYYRLSLDAVYKPKEKLRRYLLPEAWYTAVSPGSYKKSNFPYWIKVAFMLGWIFSLFTLLRLILIKRR